MPSSSPEPAPQRLMCVEARGYRDALTDGRVYDVLAYDAAKSQARIENDQGRRRWYPMSCFTTEFEPTFDLWLEFERWQAAPGAEPAEPVFDPADEACIVSVTLPFGERYALNVWTYSVLGRIVAGMRESGEALGGKYLLPPDLFVERMERGLIEEVVRRLIQTRALREEWRVRDADEVK